MTIVTEERVVFAFGDEADSGSYPPWCATDDVVMGGRSRSQFTVTDVGTRLFSGVISSENNGGFCSVRSPDFANGFGGYRGLALRVLGDGRTHTLCLHTRTLPPGTSYRCRFTPPKAEWADVSVGFEHFVLMRMGHRIGVEPVNPSHVRAVSLLIADRQEGPFALELSRLTVWG